MVDDHGGQPLLHVVLSGLFEVLSWSERFIFNLFDMHLVCTCLCNAAFLKVLAQPVWFGGMRACE